LTVRGRTRDGRPWETVVTARRREAPAITELWARGRLRDLEDRYAAGSGDASLEQRVVDTSLRFGVLCRFTAYVAVDTRVVTEGGRPHRVVQPIEPASGWDMLAPPVPPAAAGGMRLMAMRAPAAPGRGFSTAARMPAPGGMPLPDAAHLWAQPSRRRGGGFAGAVESALAAANPQLVSIRELAAVEARRLRSSAHLPEYERREILADLASRLTALISHLASMGVPEAAYAPLRRLVERLNEGGNLELMWAEALRVLDAFAATVSVVAPAPEGDRRRTFWKR
jgi:Ca-activated chloride channel family protein